MAKPLDLISLGSIAVAADCIQLDGDVPRSRIQVAKTGNWPASTKRKGGFSITTEMLRSMVTNFTQEVPIDYNHLSIQPNPTPDQVIAAGWHEKLELSDDGKQLFAPVRWTPKAAAHIKAQEFRYISPTFAFDSIDPATGQNTGAMLMCSALTNYPFLKGMQPIALSDLEHLGVVHLVDSGDLTFDEKRSRVVSALYEKFRDSSEFVDFIDLTDDYVIVRRAGRLFKLDYSITKGADVKFGEEFKEVVHQYAELTAVPPSPSGAKKPMANENDPTLASLQAELSRVTGLVTSMQTELQNTAASLTAERAVTQSLRDDLKKRDAKDKVAALIAAGKLLPKQREQMETIALSNSEWFDGFAASLEPVVSLNQPHGVGVTTQQPVGTSTGDTALDQRIASAEGDAAISLMTELVEKHRKDNNGATYSQAMAAVSTAHPDLVLRYRAAFVGTGMPGQPQ